MAQGEMGQQDCWSLIARFTSVMYVGHEVSSCGRLARRKTERLLVVFNCLLVAAWKFPCHPPKGLQGCGVPFVVFVVCHIYLLFIYLFIYLFLWRGSFD